MPRIPRRHLWTDAACYHILNRGHNRTTIFADEEDRLAFLNLLARYRKRYGFRLYHYCLMSNHFHLLVQLKRPRQLSTFMAGLREIGRSAMPRFGIAWARSEVALCGDADGPES